MNEGVVYGVIVESVEGRVTVEAGAVAGAEPGVGDEVAVLPRAFATHLVAVIEDLKLQLRTVDSDFAQWKADAKPAREILLHERHRAEFAENALQQARNTHEQDLRLLREGHAKELEWYRGLPDAPIVTKRRRRGH